MLRRAVTDDPWIRCHRRAPVWISDALKRAQHGQPQGDEERENDDSIHVEERVQGYSTPPEACDGPGGQEQARAHRADKELAKKLQGGAVLTNKTGDADHIKVKGQHSG